MDGTYRPSRSPKPRRRRYRTQRSELCASAVSLFPLLDPEKLLEEQRAEFGTCIDYVKAPVTAVPVPVPVPDGDYTTTVNHYFLSENVLFRWNFPGNLRKRSSFRDQLVLPTALRKLVVHSCHDLPGSRGHVAFKATFDKIRDRYWWRTMSKDVANTH